MNNWQSIWNYCLLALDHRHKTVPWGNRNQKMSFKFVHFLPGDTFQTVTKVSKPESSTQGGGNRNQYFSYWACFSLGAGILEKGELHKEVSPEIYKGVSLNPCPNITLNLCRARLCMPWPRVALGQLGDNGESGGVWCWKRSEASQP